MKLINELKTQQHIFTHATTLWPDSVTMHEKDAEDIYAEAVLSQPEQQAQPVMLLGSFKVMGMEVMRTRDIDRGKFIFSKNHYIGKIKSDYLGKKPQLKPV